MNEKDAIEIIKNSYEDARGSIMFRDEIQAIDKLEDYIKGSISKDKIREKLKELEKMEQNIEEVDVSRIKFAQLILENLLEG